MGGLGVFSHSKVCLTHQHWVRQVITLGGFNVSCTQGPEAGHKLNMHVAAARVRHYCANKTQFEMLRYLCNYITFEEMISGAQGLPPRVVNNYTARVSVPIRSPIPQSTALQRRDQVAYRMCFIHRQVRVVVNELYDLMCSRLGLTKFHLVLLLISFS